MLYILQENKIHNLGVFTKPFFYILPIDDSPCGLYQGFIYCMHIAFYTFEQELSKKRKKPLFLLAFAVYTAYTRTKTLENTFLIAFTNERLMYALFCFENSSSLKVS